MGLPKTKGPFNQKKFRLLRPILLGTPVLGNYQISSVVFERVFPYLTLRS